MYRVEPKSGSFSTLALNRPTFLPANGIALDDGDRVLFVADGIGLIRVYLETGTSQDVALGPKNTLAGIDGLYRRRGSASSRFRTEPARLESPPSDGPQMAKGYGHGRDDGRSGPHAGRGQPVMSALLDNGLEVTALHNHFFWDEPRVFYMHVHGHGAAAELARKLKPALDLIGKGRPPAPARRGAPAATPAIDTAKIAQIAGHGGDERCRLQDHGRPRRSQADRDGRADQRADGAEHMGRVRRHEDNAAIAGDVAMLASEVQPVLKALRKNGLDVVAIHHHMTGTQPTIYFLHYWGTGPADKLATGFKAALDELGQRALAAR